MIILKKYSGFTLVEMAIVMVIAGIIVTGVVVGKDMIDAAKNVSVVKEIQAYEEAMLIFKKKYHSWPGDIPDAGDIWGTDCDATPSNCNGDGDSAIESDDESHRAWQHLYLGEIISTSYTGEHTLGEAVIGTNVPASNNIKGVGYAVEYISSTVFGKTSANAIIAGRELENDTLLTSSFRPIDGFSIDSKMDDGLPSKGSLYGLSNSGDKCTDSVSTPEINGAEGSAEYDLSTNDTNCIIYYYFKD